MDRMHARRATLAGVHEHSCHESRWRLPRYSMSIENIRSDFALLDDWEDRYRYLIELGRTLPPLPDALRTDANKVRGCASQVWLAASIERTNGAPEYTFLADSDAHIVRGLIAILFAVYNGRTLDDVLDIDADPIFA